MFNVFVYGTLLKGNSRNSMFQKEAFMGQDELSDYRMFDMGYFPGIIFSKGGHIKGEIYQVDEALLKELDYVEVEGELYKRIEVELDSKIKAYTYVYLKELEDAPEISIDQQPYHDPFAG